MAVSTKFNTKFQKKSISLPCRSHPSTFQIEEKLNKIKSSSSSSSSIKPSADDICNGLLQLADLYHSMDDLLDSSITQNLISIHGSGKWIEEITEESMKFLDICSFIRDMAIQIKEQIQDLQCALRRRKGDSSVQNGISKYNCFRKKMKKDVKRLIVSLKQAENSIGVVADPVNRHLTAVIRAVMEVTEMTVCIFESVLMFLSAPVSKPNRWSMVVVSKLMMHKETVACEEDETLMNDLDSVDVALANIMCKSRDESSMRNVQWRLEELQGKMIRIESGLEMMFRRLVRTRATLLNIICL